MFAIGNDELKDKDMLGEYVTCKKCGEQHKVEYGDEIQKDGTMKKSKVLAFYKCGDTAFLAGINGRKI